MVRVSRVQPESVADEVGIVPGTEIVSVNGREISDFLDWEFLSAEEVVAVEARLPDGDEVVFEVERPEMDPWGITLEPPRVRRCANRCEFCFIEGLPEGLRKPLYIRDDDYRLSFAYGNFATLSNVKERDIQRILEYRLSPLYVSVHATNWEARKVVLNNPRVPNIVEQLTRLAAGGIQFHCQMVVVPGLNDGEVLEESLRDLWNLGDAVISAAVVPVGLTQFSHLYTGKSMDRANALALLAHVERWGERAARERGTTWVFGSDELYLLAGRELPGPSHYGDFAQIENGIGAVTSLRMRLDAGIADVPEMRDKRIGVVTGVSMRDAHATYARRPGCRDRCALRDDRHGELALRPNHDRLRPPRRRGHQRALSRDVVISTSRSSRRRPSTRMGSSSTTRPSLTCAMRSRFRSSRRTILSTSLPRRPLAGCGMSTPVVALVGRPNVGKSALFNRIVGGNSAIVSEEAGTTRDRHFGRAEWNGHAFWLVDTGGLPENTHEAIDAEIRRQVLEAIAEADLLVFVVDAKQGLHPSDSKVLDLLRDSRKPWLVVANKVDDPASLDYYEFFALGAGDPVPVSATNGKGSGDLLDAIVERIPESAEEWPDAIRVAVIGRPNVGKSSIVNRLLGEQRLVVSEVAGTTRDAIDTPLRYHGRDFVFVDTAGLRRQSKIDDGIEFYSSLRTRRAIERAEVCILVIDAIDGLHNQDLKIATMAWDAGRALMLIVNKWDLKEKDNNTAAKFQKEIVEKAPYLNFVPFIFTSAITGQRVSRILDTILEIEQEREKRVTTSDVNTTLQDLLARRQPPQAAGIEVKLNYATQVETAPPTIAVFGNHPELVQEHYVRYLHNGFRAAYGFTGNPLNIVLRRKSA